MSRIAKNPINIPSGTEVKIKNGEVIIKGKQGELKQKYDSVLLDIKIDNNTICFETKNDSKKSNAISGTMRAQLANMIKGVTEGFERKLQLVGVGYRAQAQGNTLNLSLGYSHPIIYKLPEGLTAQTPSQTEIVISGFDKQKVGQVAAEIRKYRPPEPYKGKGVRYSDEYVVIKETTKK